MEDIDWPFRPYTMRSLLLSFFLFFLSLLSLLFFSFQALSLLMVFGGRLLWENDTFD